MDRNDYVQVLEALERLPFNMGKKALVSVLTGDAENDTIKRNRLDKETCFGCLSGYSQEEAQHLLSWLMVNGLVQQIRPQGKFFKVLGISSRGRQELLQPSFEEKKDLQITEATVTDEDRQIFTAFDFFLSRYNQDQKKAIIPSRRRNVLCVAGAGTGKTTVLTKRIEFLVRFCGVPRERVLAITFTRKAREEMQRRLHGMVQVETFNSFCERLLTQHGGKLYGKPVRMLRYSDRIRLLHHAVKKLSMDMSTAISMYFTSRQRKEKTNEQLARLFMNDCFSIMDYYANNNEQLQDFSSGSVEGKMVYNICLSMRQEMKELGLRDYSDQLRDGLRLLRKYPEMLSHYDHIMVDEYQDVNLIQKELLNTLKPNNLFVVGDPRQSIFGWRGSRIEFILEFEHHYNDSETIVLKKNYRSGGKIVALMNACINRLRLPDLTEKREGGTIKLHKFRSEDEEIAFLAEKVLSSNVPYEEMFVLTRTNRQLQEISTVFKARDIPHVLRSDEVLGEARQGEVTLSTVHAIKGMEATLILVAFCNAQSFPCIATDHPVLDLVKREAHDREEEELRLFYVAMSRAKEELHLTFSGTPTMFLSREMKKLLGFSYDRSLTAQYRSQGANGDIFNKLRAWRTSVSRKAGIPAYMILPDKTLLQLAEQQPTLLSELNEISGIGPVKVDKYGDDILAVLNGNV